MPLKTFIIYPTLGFKTNVPHNDLSLFQSVGDRAALVYAVGGLNIDCLTKRNSATKSKGRFVYSASAAGTTTKCVGLFELYDGTNRVHWAFMTDGTSNGRVFRYSNRVPGRLCDTADCGGTPVNFNTSDIQLWSIIRFGSYMVFADHGTTMPYCCDYNDTALSKLMDAGTEYVFRYLESFQGRIIGAYSDQTNGDLEVRWNDTRFDTPGGMQFGAGDQLYRPNDDPITGIKRMGQNACFLYGDNSIDRIDYYSSYSTPFGITSMLSNVGFAGHHSIVDTGGKHYGFSSQYGFLAYDGGTGIEIISPDIETEISTISKAYYGIIVGTYIPQTYEIVWSVPADSSSSCTRLWFYNLLTKDWRFEDKGASFIDYWIIDSTLTWTALINLGYVTWQDLIDEGLRWQDLYSTNPNLVMSQADGHVYQYSGSTDNGGNYDAYRIEPALSLAGQKTSLKEIWFELTRVGNFSINLWYRSGKTIGETEAANWESLGSISCNNPSEPMLPVDKTANFHQIKWGSNSKNDRFGVNAIHFKYIPQGSPY